MGKRAFAIVTAAALGCGTPALAQPPAAPSAEIAAAPAAEAQDAIKLKTAEPEVQLAQRIDPQPAVTVKRPRAARVTTCRCGDPATQQ